MLQARQPVLLLTVVHLQYFTSCYIHRVSGKKTTSVNFGHTFENWRTIFRNFSLIYYQGNSFSVYESVFHLTLTVLLVKLGKFKIITELWLLLEKLMCYTWNLAKLNKIQNMLITKYHTNGLLNFCKLYIYIMCRMLITKFRIGQNYKWSDDKLCWRVNNEWCYGLQRIYKSVSYTHLTLPTNREV